MYLEAVLDRILLPHLGNVSLMMAVLRIVFYKEGAKCASVRRPSMFALIALELIRRTIGFAIAQLAETVL